MNCHEDAFLVLERLGHHGNTGGGQPPPPTVTHVQHSGAIAVLERISKYESAVKEGGGAEMTAFGGGGVKGGDIKGVQKLRAPPQDGLILQISVNSAIEGGL